MNLDTAIQNLILKSSDCIIADLAWQARNERTAAVKRYQEAYNWDIADCNEFLDNASIAYELLVKEQAA